MLARPRIRQLSLGELLDETFRMYRRDLLTLIVLAALVIVPYTILNTIVSIPLQQEVAMLEDAAAFEQLTEEEVDAQIQHFLMSSLLTAGAAIGFGLLYTVVFQPIMEGALARAVTRRYLDQPVSVGDSIGVALRRAFALIAARLIPSLVVFVLFLIIFGGLFLVAGGAALFMFMQGVAPADGDPTAGIGFALSLMVTMFCLMPLFALVIFAFYVRILFTSQAIIAESKGPLEALSRSWNLTKGFWWRTLGYLLVIVIINAIITFVPTVLASGLAAVFVEDVIVLQLINGAVSAIGSVLVTPFTLIAVTLMYFDLRIRKEGFDLEQQVRSLVPEYDRPPYGQPLGS